MQSTLESRFNSKDMGWTLESTGGVWLDADGTEWATLAPGVPTPEDESVDDDAKDDDEEAADPEAADKKELQDRRTIAIKGESADR